MRWVWFGCRKAPGLKLYFTINRL